MSKKKEITNSWLAGLNYFGKKGFIGKFKLRQRVLEVSEWSFTHAVTYEGSVKRLLKSLAHYPLIEYRPSQITETIRVMMDAGIDIRNMETIYKESPLDEFKTVMISQDGTLSELVLKRSKDIITKKVIGQKNPIEVSFDCPLDAYIVYGRKGHPSRKFRICRATADDGKVCWIYTEANPLDQKLFDFYQKTGMQFYRMFLVMQFLWMHKDMQMKEYKNELFEQTAVRDGSKYESDPKDPHKRAKHVKIPIRDYRLGDLSKLTTRMCYVDPNWHSTFRAFSVQGWPKDGDYVIDDPRSNSNEDDSLPEVSSG